MAANPKNSSALTANRCRHTELRLTEENQR